MSRFACKCCGVDLTDEKAKEAFLSLESLYGKQLTVTSAYRCPKHNRAVGGGKNSRHMTFRDAFDLLFPNNEERKAFLEMAVKAGFLGIGLGKTFIHIDRRKTHTIWIYK